MRFRFTAVLLLLLLFSTVTPLFPGEGKEETKSRGEVTEPHDPSTPDVDIKDKKEYNFQASVRFGSGKSREVTLVLIHDSLTFFSIEEGVRMKRTVKFSQVSSIEILHWAGKERRKSEYVFRPSHLRIRLRSGSILDCDHSIQALEKIKYINKKGEQAFLFTFFYDYRKMSRWVNAGKEDMAYPEKNPHPETVVSIAFKHQGGDMLDLLRKITE